MLKYRAWINTATKGQLISKCLFGVFDFSQKTNENKSTWGIIVVKSNFFVGNFVQMMAPKGHFEINWPLLWYLRLTCFRSFFGRNRRHQKDTLKITDLYDKAVCLKGWMPLNKVSMCTIFFCLCHQSGLSRPLTKARNMYVH